MAYLNTHARTTSNADTFQPAGRTATLFGVFVGFVKDANDVQRNGRLKVWIPEFGSSPDNQDGWIIVNYCSPFAGATNVETISKSDIEVFEGTQTSYGMWMVPPDINNQVLIMFINGDASRGIWIGSLYNQYMNNMVPGMATDAKNWQYPGKEIPVAEYNKWDTKVTQPDRAIHPYERTKFAGVGNQGLINDKTRGVTSSSARREAPSNVYGILTPGPKIDETAPPEKVRRKGGSSLIMDDGTGSEYVQIATKSGAQIRLDETNGNVYIINRDGTGWIQIDSKGNIDVFGANDISLRAQRDFNIRADRNINIEAGQNIFMKAAKDTTEGITTFTYDVNNITTPKKIPVWKYVGEGKGQGGNIVMQALNNWHSTTQKSAFLTVVENNMDIKIGNAFSMTTQNGGQDFNSKQGVKITTDAALDIAATGNIRVGSKGVISVVGVGGIVACTDADLSLKAQGNIRQAAASDILLSSMNVGLDANVAVSGKLGVVGVIGSPTIANIQSKSASIAGGISTPSPGSASAPPGANPAVAEGAQSANTARPAEVKPLNDKINILATWVSNVKYPQWKANLLYRAGTIVIHEEIIYISHKEQPPLASFPGSAYWSIYTTEDKFKRNSQPLQTTTSRFPTYEPCPEHGNFSGSTVSTTASTITQPTKTYEGSAGAGNDARVTPAPAEAPGANNTSVAGDPPADSSASKDFNTKAFECQLKIHEGVRYNSYLDTHNLPTGGIGHLLRANEISQYPIGAPISEAQVQTWFSQDSVSAIQIAQELVTNWNDLCDVRKRACADLAYNLGKPRLSKFTNFLNAMKAGQFDRAGQELRNSKWFTQVGKRGPNIVTMIVQDVDPNGCDKKFPG